MQLPPLTRRLIPRFTAAAAKGDHGRILVVGGGGEYTGAPFYAASAALKTGSDLAIVVCSVDATVPIRVHGGGELIVHGLLDVPHDPIDPRLASVLERVHAVVVGPGLSRGASALATAAAVLQWTRARGVPIVCDGDALWMAAQNPALIRAHASVVLTPNAVEYARLWVAAGGGAGVPGDAAALSSLLGGVAVLRKGSDDDIACGTIDSGAAAAISCTISDAGSPRRCGGQGDVLAGSCATFLAWAARGGWLSGREGVSRAESLVAAAAGGALLTRTAAAAAFEDCGRATTTPDILARVGRAFETAFPDTLW